MSQDTSSTPDPRPTLGLESGLEALRESSEFRGPVEPLDHQCNDHLALIYEDRDQQLATAVPFVEQGLERGERCMYVTGDNTKAEVLAAMREAGVDVDGAMASGALTFHTQYDTYLKDETFDPGAMIDLYADAIEEAKAEDYTALRIAAETAWLMPDGVSLEDFMAYESRVNALFDDEDCIALCQYNRNQLPEETIRDIVRTHPHLVYDSTVCHNYYYTPPEEYFGPDRPAYEVDRMLRTLHDRTRATIDLRRNERQLQRQNNRLESFASMLAHELRNPLQIAQIYLRRAAEGDSAAVAEVETALSRIEEMIDVLLITTRTTDAPLAQEEVSLADAATDVWDDMGVASAELIVDTDCTVSADAIHLWHLLENLFSNSVEHAGPDVTVRIGDLPDGDGFFVADDGPGIPDADREAVFEAGHTTCADGIGLGLTFVGQLAAAYAWTCAVSESEMGGARFEFRVDESTS
ncbi:MULTISPECIES: MEDS domain-containing protein [Halorussus]|uniref:MEDS domain-containing protein n=1 Tax=Halorussus TaxID=1070314 RepID=UPI0020A2040E|nr:MEDS domain-containing protein [Halorussus vallis]USZ77084.1 MEDS domain-containing protein [Halorussus vallis]